MDYKIDDSIVGQTIMIEGPDGVLIPVKVKEFSMSAAVKRAGTDEWEDLGLQCSTSKWKMLKLKVRKLLGRLFK